MNTETLKYPPPAWPAKKAKTAPVEPFMDLGGQPPTNVVLMLAEDNGDMLEAEHRAAGEAAERAKLRYLLQLMQEVLAIAAHGVLPDGDTVNTPTLLWAEEWALMLTPNLDANRS